VPVAGLVHGAGQAAPDGSLVKPVGAAPPNSSTHRRPPLLCDWKLVMV